MTETITTSHIGFGEMTITAEEHNRLFPCLLFVINKIADTESGDYLYGTHMCGLDLEVVGSPTIEHAVTTTKDWVLKKISGCLEKDVPLNTLLRTTNNKDMERLIAVYTDLSIRKHIDFTTKQTADYRIAYAVTQDSIPKFV